MCFISCSTMDCVVLCSVQSVILFFIVDTRLYLEEHSIAQVLVGIMVGCCYGFFLFFVNERVASFIECNRQYCRTFYQKIAHSPLFSWFEFKVDEEVFDQQDYSAVANVLNEEKVLAESRNGVCLKEEQCMSFYEVFVTEKATNLRILKVYARLSHQGVPNEYPIFNNAIVYYEASQENILLFMQSVFESTQQFIPFLKIQYHTIPRPLLRKSTIPFSFSIRGHFHFMVPLLLKRLGVRKSAEKRDYHNSHILTIQDEPDQGVS